MTCFTIEIEKVVKILKASSQNHSSGTLMRVETTHPIIVTQSISSKAVDVSQISTSRKAHFHKRVMPKTIIKYVKQGIVQSPLSFSRSKLQTEKDKRESPENKSGTNCAICPLGWRLSTADNTEN